jgi:CTP synthase (UTP-ammonia lyase)
MLTISVVMDFCVERPSHRATLAALDHAAEAADVNINVGVVGTDAVDEGFLSGLTAPSQAVVIGPGTPYRSPDGAHAVIRMARERGVPLVAT